VGKDDGNSVKRTRTQDCGTRPVNGRFSYQIFTVAGEPRTLLGSRRIRSYASSAEAAKAGLEAAAVLNCIGHDLI
jgi:hypothetical protein